jgi:pyridoxal phosphate enzyme (YggS family)
LDSLDHVLERIGEACSRSGRGRSEVTLIAVSKKFPAERVREVIDAGHTLFGENRVQEALAKIPEVGPPARWHMIGHLQRNKARHAVGVFEMIHSVDGAALAAELDKRASGAGIVQPVLVQINQGGEESKSGIPAHEAERFVRTILDHPQLDLQGLMTIPPWSPDPEESRRWFSELRELRDRIETAVDHPLPELSMGMTDDFEVAIEEGATLIRVGRAIFGPRR